MLEVVHLKRVYKVKGGEPVYALNDVSLKFPETGLVFILGKSGSGKSTLLNVMGGLDEVDEGEIIINNKSSKHFSKGEMDSYRNTYLGFIFQEYNILSDFTVQENIALALQLQHKKATDEAINKILEEVDLLGYGKRKPNELSGGQKQRVAIARALVKEPKIIFGDEPTGALDSKTGKQVFETLKKLSKDKLVVIVSHDRDFAEHFGDRVIELKDGKVISDITKTSMTSKMPKEGLFLVGDNIIRLNKNRPLKADDLPLINEAIANANGDVYISADNHVNNALCEAAKINKEGNRDEFKDTDPNSIKSGDEDFKPIKSKFSLGHAFKMGSRSLRVKPFRLAMTILLSTIAFTLFGASLTMSFFSSKSAVNSTVSKNKITNVSFSIQGKRFAYLNDTIVKEIEDATNSYVYVANKISASIETVDNTTDLFHPSKYSSNIHVEDSFLDDFDCALVAGELPKTEAECAIPLYAYYSYEDFGFINNNGESVKDVDYDNVIGSSIKYSDESSKYGYKSYTITGIVDTKLPEKLLEYRKKNSSEITRSDPNYDELVSLSNGYESSIHTSLFTIAPSNSANKDIVISYPFDIESNEKGTVSLNLGHYYSLEGYEYYFDSNKKSLNSGEITMSANTMLDILSIVGYYDPTVSYSEGTLIYALFEIIECPYLIQQTYVDDNYLSIYEKYKNNDNFQDIGDNPETELIKEACRNFLFMNESGLATSEYEEYLNLCLVKEKETLANITETISLPKISGVLPTADMNDNGLEPAETWEFDIVGLNLNIDNFSYRANISLVDANEIFNKLSKNGFNYDSSLPNSGFLVIGEDLSKIDKFMDLYQAKRAIFNDYGSAPDDAWYIYITNSTISSVISIASMIEILTQVFLYIGIAMAVFSMLLFYNFISVSINNKKREIGILRAVGAKRSDVFKIFYSESFIIASINFVLSLVAVFAISYLMNTNLARSAGLGFDIMVPNIIVIVGLFAISMVSSIISSFLPVTKIANKKPIDAIHNR